MIPIARNYFTFTGKLLISHRDFRKDLQKYPFENSLIWQLLALTALRFESIKDLVKW
jgi:hypothetical protein